MKKFFVTFLILFLVLFTAIIKNSTKRIDDEIFSLKENIRESKRNFENIKLEHDYLSSTDKLLDYQNLYFDEQLFEKDIQYVVMNNKVLIVDEQTGRIMDGRRYSDGLHQAIEAKEKVQIQNENQTLASITFQNYFRRIHYYKQPRCRRYG